jgi:hypothetical protein
MAIDAGSGNVGSGFNSWGAAEGTNLDSVNPIAAAGTLDHFLFSVVTDATGIKVGTFYNVGSNDWKCRDFDAIANQSAGDVDVAVTLNAEVDDVIGMMVASGAIRTEWGGSGCKRYAGDAFDANAHTYSADGSTMHIYATGTESGGAVITCGSQPQKMLSVGLI